MELKDRTRKLKRYSICIYGIKGTRKSNDGKNICKYPAES